MPRADRSFIQCSHIFEHKTMSHTWFSHTFLWPTYMLDLKRSSHVIKGHEAPCVIYYFFYLKDKTVVWIFLVINGWFFDREDDSSSLWSGTDQIPIRGMWLCRLNTGSMIILCTTLTWTIQTSIYIFQIYTAVLLLGNSRTHDATAGKIPDGWSCQLKCAHHPGSVELS